MPGLILRVCLVIAPLLLGFSGSAAWGAAPEQTPTSKTESGAPSESPDSSVSRQPDIRRRPGLRPQPGSATGRASHREGPPPAAPQPPAPPPPKEPPIVKEIAPVAPAPAPAPTMTAGSYQTGPPATGGPTRKEGALEPTSLEDKLLERGVISREDWLEIKADEERRLADRTEAIEFTGSPRWYERLRLYGYFMFRYNRLGHPNDQLISWQDVSVGKQTSETGGGNVQFGQPGFFTRRIRTVLAGEVSDRVSVFLQTDFATQVSQTNTQVATLVDAWGEYYFDPNKEYRLRIGQQRVPCSFDNWQASRQRMAIDRADATNACGPGERDIGVSFQWSPKWAQHRWKQMIDYMYGGGDWGMVNLSVYNGQGRNFQEYNDNKHIAIRLAYPIELPGGRLMEVGMNANRGKYTVDFGTPNPATSTLFSFNQQGGFNRTDYRDEHLDFYIYYPPQPWGFLAEYITGRTPKRGSDGIVQDRSLHGGYIQGHYQWKYSDTSLVNFYSRYQEYYGGLKHLNGAPDGRMKELEVGAAWMPDPQWEITLAYTFTQRLNFTQMVGPANPTNAISPITNQPYCSSGPTNGLGTPPGPVGPDNSLCSPTPQFDAYGNLIRLQVMWFWN